MNILSNFSETLSELMLIHNLRTKQLAEQISIDASSITKYFRESVIPNLPHAISIADFFGCSLDYLFGLTYEFEKKIYLPCPPFSQAFDDILKFHNRTKYRLAKDLKFSNQSTIAWHKGKSIPTMDNLIKIADYFGCTLDELVGRKCVE
ncbi:MAG: transcriptional regulator, partial [Clostridia bacterium]|nr:transcriptional regulator [Clostridia bacterium]